jgi:hypothetical protein
MAKITEYFERYALVSLEKQEKLARLIGEHAIELDIDSGKIRFNDYLAVHFQMLGTESGNTLTWLWAWAEEQPHVPAHVLSAAFQLKNWGEKHDVPEFSSPSVDLNTADGPVISLISSEVCNASCYYRDPYDGGALYVLLFDKSIDYQPPLDLVGLSRGLSNLISLYEFNHKNALLSYFRMKGLSPAGTGAKVVCELESGEQMVAEFDDSGRLRLLNEGMIDT